MTKKVIRRKHLMTFLTTGQAARHCQVSVGAFRKWIQDGRVAFRRTPGGHYRINHQEFQEFLQQHGLPAYPVAAPEVRILIADDEPEILDMLWDFLSADPRGFKLETATDGYEALIKVGAFQPNVLILDVVMPKLDGIEVCRRLKATPGTRSIKLFGITGYPGTIPRLLDAGVDVCLTKPLDLPQMKQELERLLALT